VAVREGRLAVVRLVGAGLITRSFSALLNVDPGFDRIGVSTIGVQLPPARYKDQPARAAFFNTAQVLVAYRLLPPDAMLPWTLVLFALAPTLLLWANHRMRGNLPFVAAALWALAAVYVKQSGWRLPGSDTAALVAVVVVATFSRVGALAAPRKLASDISSTIPRTRGSSKNSAMAGAAANIAPAVSRPAMTCQVKEKRMSSSDTCGSSIRFQLKLAPERKEAKVRTVSAMP